MTPLVPTEVDLRGMPWMPLDTVRLIDSDLFALSTGDEFKAAVALWCKSWTQVPAASLPNDDRILAHLSGTASRWKRVKATCMRGWVLCDDGRYYHPVIAEKALEAWKEREEFQDRQENESTRLQNFRAEHKALRKALRAHGIVLPFDTKIDVLRERVANLPETKPEMPIETPPETKTFQDGNACNAPAMAKTGTGTGTGIKDQEQQGGSAPAEPPQPDDDESGSPTVDPVPYQAIVQAYHDRLPQLARVRLVTAQRRTSIRRAWQSLPTEHRRIGAFRAIFAECAMDDFLNGNGPYSGEHANWRPDFDHLIKLKTLTRVYEKAMDRRERLRQESPAQSTLGAAA